VVLSTRRGETGSSNGPDEPFGASDRRVRRAAAGDASRNAADLATDACIPAALHGDDGAFARLYRDINPRLLRYATVLVGQEAEDVVSESWLQIARDLPRFSGGLNELRAWTARIVRNRAMDHIRAAGRRPAHTDDLAAVVDRPGPEDTAAAADETISTGRAIALIATLPQRQAEAVLLRAVVGLDPVAAAKILGCRPGAVRVAAHRGLQHLAEQLGARQGLAGHRD
jgi:RNA polymerase sigma-70 factor (ECF subfamily)